MDILKYINENYLILIAVLYVLGVFFKNTSKIPDWIIPWLLLFVSIVFSIWIGGFTANVIIQGILVAGAAVLTNQLYKQTITEGLSKFIEPSEATPVKEIEPTNTTNNDKIE